MTKVSIEGEKWLIDGVPTHRGREYRGISIECLLMNSRMANGLFDDENLYTRHLWSYPDTNAWDADRNTDELIRILQPPRIHELIELAQSIYSDGRRLLVGTSFTRRMTLPEPVIAASDFILLHGNGITDPPEIGEKVRAVRESSAYRGQPIAFNEDDHFDFDKPVNNFAVALENRAGWGFFDPRPGAGGLPAYGDYRAGYQNPPINWGLNNDRKKGFFRILSEVTGQSLSLS